MKIYLGVSPEFNIPEQVRTLNKVQAKYDEDHKEEEEKESDNKTSDEPLDKTA